MLARDSSSGSAERSSPAPGQRSRPGTGAWPPSLTGRLRSPIGGVQVQRARVDAVTLPRWSRPIVEYVAQVTTASPADDLGPAHPQAVVRSQFDVLGHRGLIEARPTRTRFELRLRVEQLS